MRILIALLFVGCTRKPHDGPPTLQDKSRLLNRSEAPLLLHDAGGNTFCAVRDCKYSGNMNVYLVPAGTTLEECKTLRKGRSMADRRPEAG